MSLEVIHAMAREEKNVTYYGKTIFIPAVSIKFI